MKEGQNILTLNSVELVRPLFYFDVFSYPLTLDEIYRFSHTSHLTKDNLKFELERLVNLGILFNINGFYLLENKRGAIDKRLDNNRRAQKYLSKARKIAKAIAFFPFVRAVFVSGSLSKNSMPKDGDIDYFIVTKPGRLWVARTLLVLFKKIFLFNSHKYFCVNYFVDELHLEIEEQNLFTATEVVTLLPLYGKGFFKQLSEANQWVNTYYPVLENELAPAIPTFKKKWTQRIVEAFFYGTLGDRIDDFLMNKTFNYWKRKFKDISANRFEIALKSRKYVSKHHPSDFQKKVLEAYAEREKRFKNKLEQLIQKLAYKAS